MNNFGVELFLDKFLSMGTTPGPMATSGPGGSEDRLDPSYPEFSGFVFKLQANLDPRHRDRLAYVRIVSGKYEKGMKVRRPHASLGVCLSPAMILPLFPTSRGCSRSLAVTLAPFFPPCVNR